LIRRALSRSPGTRRCRRRECWAILVAMETVLTLILTGFVLVSVVLGLAAAVAMVKAPYNK